MNIQEMFRKHERYTSNHISAAVLTLAEVIVQVSGKLDEIQKDVEIIKDEVGEMNPPKC